MENGKSSISFYSYFVSQEWQSKLSISVIIGMKKKEKFPYFSALVFRNSSLVFKNG